MSPRTATLTTSNLSSGADTVMAIVNNADNSIAERRRDADGALLSVPRRGWRLRKNVACARVRVLGIVSGAQIRFATMDPTSGLWAVQGGPGTYGDFTTYEQPTLANPIRSGLLVNPWQEFRGNIPLLFRPGFDNNLRAAWSFEKDHDGQNRSSFAPEVDGIYTGTMNDMDDRVVTTNSLACSLQQGFNSSVCP